MLLSSQKGKAAVEKESELCEIGRGTSLVSGTHCDSFVFEEKLKNVILLQGGGGAAVSLHACHAAQNYSP